MLIVTQEQLDQLGVDAAGLQAAVDEYQAAVIAHASTVGVPAPLPAFEIVYAIIAAGGFTVQEPAPPPPGPDLQERYLALNGFARQRRKFVRAAKINPIAALLLKEGIK